jgi:hypothetical protein
MKTLSLSDIITNQFNIIITTTNSIKTKEPPALAVNDQIFDFLALWTLK